MPASILLQSSPPVPPPFPRRAATPSLLHPLRRARHDLPSPPTGEPTAGMQAAALPAFHLGEVNDGSDFSLKIEKNNFQTHFGASGETRQPTKNDCGGKSGAGSAQTRSDGRVNERRLGFFKTLVRSSFFFPSLEQFRLIEGMSV